jgi:hypothetical protein
MMTRPDEDLATDDANGDRAGSLEPDERDPEAPTADLVEQSASVSPVQRQAEVHPGLEVGEWDAVEQSIVIDMDDEYDH